MTATMAARYGVRSAMRTEEGPRAFTLGEFARGATFAWLAFQPLAAAGSFIAGIFDHASTMMAIAIPTLGLPITFLATLLGSPVAFVLGWRLRKQRRDPVHLLAFGLYGSLWGIAVQVLMYQGEEPIALLVALTPATTAAVLTGWWTTSRMALRADRRTADSGPLPLPEPDDAE